MKTTLSNYFEILEIGENSHITHEGYLKCSAVLCKSGVIHHDDYILYVTSESLNNSVELWNGQPVTLYHEFLDSQNHDGAVGTVYNVYCDQKDDETYLLGDIKIMDKDLITSILSGENRSLSIGFYWGKVSKKKGVYKGEPYNVKIETLIPNHLAICPNGTSRVQEAKIIFGKKNKQEGEFLMKKQPIKKSAFSEDEDPILDQTEEETENSEDSLEERISKIEETLGVLLSRLDAATSQDDSSLNSEDDPEDDEVIVTVEKDGQEKEVEFSKASKKELQQYISKESQRIALELNAVQNQARSIAVAFSLTDDINEIKRKVVSHKLPSLKVKNISDKELDYQYKAAIAFSKQEKELMGSFPLGDLKGSQGESPSCQFTKNRMKALDFQ